MEHDDPDGDERTWNKDEKPSCEDAPLVAHDEATVLVLLYTRRVI